MRELWVGTRTPAHICAESSNAMRELNDALLENTRLKSRVRELMARDLRLCQAAGRHAAEAHRWKLMTACLFIMTVGSLCAVMLLAR